MAKSVPSSHLRLPLNSKGANAATLQRIASAASGNSGNPLQPEPPPMQPLDQLHRSTGGPGGSTFLLPPGGFAPLSTRESGSQAAIRVVPERRRLSKQITIYRVAENPPGGRNSTHRTSALRLYEHVSKHSSNFSAAQKRPAAPCKPPGPARATGRRIHFSGNQKLMLP